MAKVLYCQFFYSSCSSDFGFVLGSYCNLGLKFRTGEFESSSDTGQYRSNLITWVQSRVFDPFDFSYCCLWFAGAWRSSSWPGVEIEGCSRFIVDIYLWLLYLLSTFKGISEFCQQGKMLKRFSFLTPPKPQKIEEESELEPEIPDVVQSSRPVAEIPSRNGPGGPARPLRLVYLDERGNFKMDPEAIAALHRVKGPLGVVAVCGRARQGKSFILNQVCFQSYLDVVIYVFGSFLTVYNTYILNYPLLCC